MITTSPLEAIARDRSIPGAALRLYVYLSFELDREGWRPVKLKVLARFLGLRHSTTSESLGQLTRGGYLLRSPDRAWPGGPFRYRLPPIPS